VRFFNPDMKILMVCLGNICRSPIAEGVLQAQLLKSRIHSVTVDSAGLLSYHVGEQPDKRAMETAVRFGVDISHQQARQIRTNDFSEFDLLFAMDQSVLNQLLSINKTAKFHQRIHLFLEYAGYPEGSIVPDPYYGTLKDFEECYKLIEHASAKILKRMIENGLK